MWDFHEIWAGNPVGHDESHTGEFEAVSHALVLTLIPNEQPVVLVGDDTVDHGKARHRDPVRSSHGCTAWRYGHKWVVLVRFPWANRPWALSVLVATSPLRKILFAGERGHL